MVLDHGVSAQVLMQMCRLLSDEARVDEVWVRGESWKSTRGLSQQNTPTDDTATGQAAESEELGPWQETRDVLAGFSDLELLTGRPRFVHARKRCFRDYGSRVVDFQLLKVIVAEFGHGW